MSRYRVVENVKGDKSKFYTVEKYSFDDIWRELTDIKYKNLTEAMEIAKSLYNNSVINTKTVASYG